MIKVEAAFNRSRLFRFGETEQSNRFDRNSKLFVDADRA
jgi:hypothetical protein